MIERSESELDKVLSGDVQEILSQDFSPKQ